MTEEAQRVAMAEINKWQKCPFDAVSYYVPIGKAVAVACDPLHSLDAMHEAEKVLLNRGDDWGVYCDHLMEIKVKNGGYQNAETVIHATAAQRAEAFLRTLNIWDDTK